MHLSTHTWMRIEPLDTTLARIAALGYGSVELDGDLQRHPVPQTRVALGRHGIRCWGAVTNMMGELSLIAADPEIRARSVAYAQEVVRFVHALDGQVVTVVPATVGVTIPGAPPAAEWEWAVASIRAVQAVAGPLGVRLGVEPLNRFETYFLHRADQAMALAEAVGADCGICLDAFHMNLEEPDFFGAVTRSAARLVDFHVADNNRMAPGQGAMDWPRIVATLRSAGYDGALTAEFLAPIDRTPVSPWPNQADTAPSAATPEQLDFIRAHGAGAVSEAFYTAMTARTAETLLPLIA